MCESPFLQFGAAIVALLLFSAHPSNTYSLLLTGHSSSAQLKVVK